MISIVIPACNEEAVIGRTLRALADGLYGLDGRGTPKQSVRAIVVCNGCSDQTEREAKRAADDIRQDQQSSGVAGAASSDDALPLTIEVVQSEPGKACALNRGDALAGPMSSGDARVYLDADVIMNGRSLVKLVETLAQPGVLAASPQMAVNLTDRPWMVTAFYRHWMQSAFHRIGRLGSGVYAVNAEGRDRFARFPSIIADDEFVRRRFSPGERVVVADATFTIQAPHRLWALIQVKTRSRLGRLELDRLERQGNLPRRAANRPTAVTSEIAAAGPSQAAESKGGSGRLDWLAYGLVTLASRLRARGQFLTRNSWTWERDESTRTGSDGGSPGIKPVTRSVTSW